MNELKLFFQLMWSQTWAYLIQKYNLYPFLSEQIFHNLYEKVKKLTSDSFLGSISRNLANKMKFETPKLQIPKYQKYGKMPSWKSQNLIKTLKSLPLRILESVGGVERTFQKVYFFAKNHWFSQIFSKFLLTTNKSW